MSRSSKRGWTVTPARARVITLALVMAVFFGMCGPYPLSWGGSPVVSAAPAPAVGTGSGGPAPIIIVFDLSSSMTEDDGTGTVKLAGAKRSLKTLVDRQPPNTEMGLWTYPTASDSCSAGGFVYGSGLQKVADPSTLSATIDGLQANGDTPTGDALRSAADAVRAQGRTEATFVLVSDGESNCGNDPCDVAKSISAEGFDITVQAMGSQISDEGRDELECIAEATQGAYYDVTDSEQLSAKLSELSVPAIELTINAPSSAPSGATATVTSTVTNSSVQSIEGVMVGLQFRRGDTKSAVLSAVIPPRYRLGTLAPGATVTRSWTVSTTEPGVPGYMYWSVGAWGDTTLPVRQRGTIEITDGQRPVQAGGLIKEIKTSTHPAVIMGDSFSSGEGTGDYLPANKTHAQLCHRSDKQYATGVMKGATNPTVINIACSGAVMSVLSSPKPGGQSEWNTSNGQIQILNDTQAPSSVFMTLGGNDIGFAKLAETCLIEANCQRNEDIKANVANGLVALDGLNRYYNNVFRVANTDGKRSARDGAIAPVIVLAYPDIVPPTDRANCDALGLTRQEVDFLNNTLNGLNFKIRTEVAQAWANGSEVYFVDDTSKSMAPDHHMCDAKPYAVPASAIAGIPRRLFDLSLNNPAYQTAVVSGRLQELAHPNIEGHNAMAASIHTWSTKVGLKERPVYSDVPEAEIDLKGGTQRPDDRTDIEANKLSDAVIEAGDNIVVTELERKFRPLLWVQTLMQSEPRILANTRADENGVVVPTFTIPADTPPGIHHLTFSGTDAQGNYHQEVYEIRVKQRIPWWYWGFAAVTGLSALGALAALWQARRLR